MGEPVNLVAPDGTVHSFSEDQVGGALAQGFRQESRGEADTRLARENTGVDSTAGAVAAGGAGFLRGATLGGSDLLFDAWSGGEAGDALNKLRDAHRGVSIGAEIIGGVAGVGPAGLVSKAGAKIAARGAEAGLVGKAAWGAGGAAFEGAANAGGSYLSSVALEDKPLSAEGFVGAMGGGALFGGALGAGLGVAEKTLLRAKALFPRHEVTREAAETVEREAHSAVTTMADDAKAMQQTARQRLDELRVQHAEQRLAADRQVADLRTQTEAAKLERQQALTERAKNPPARTRKAFDEPAAAPAAPATAAPAPAAPADDLMAQLQSTKAALDNGADFAALSARNPEAAKLADAVQANEQAMSELDAWLAKYGGKKSSVSQFERKAATEDWIAARRSTGPGWVEQAAEGNAVVRRGRSMEWRGSEAERKAAEDAITAKVSPEERLAAEQAADIVAGRWRDGAKGIGEQVLGSAASPAPASLDEKIGAALKPHVGKGVDVGPDLTEAATVIGKVESTSADLAEALGSAAPQAARERAQAFRDAVAAKTEQTAAATAQTADDIATKLVPEVARSTGKAPTGEMLGRLSDLGAGLEVLKAIGVGVPDLERIPVVGPVLSMYLKARAAAGVFRRAGGAVPKTTEAVIAAKKAVVQNRVNESVVKMLDVGAKAARTAQSKAGPMAGLSMRLFTGPAREEKTPRQQYDARMDELARASQPGAIRTAVRDSLHTSDPALQAEIIATLERKAMFLNGKAPRPLQLPTLLKGDGEWKPSKVQLEQFARYIRAAEDPASVLEDAAAGRGVTIEAAETLRTVYPSLYRQAQVTLMQRAEQMRDTLPYARRLTLSVLFDIPVDGTMSPEHLQFLQGPPAQTPAPAQGSPMQAPPTPTVAGQVALGDRTMTALDRRAGA